jgi:hypothetical protein
MNSTFNKASLEFNKASLELVSEQPDYYTAMKNAGILLEMTPAEMKEYDDFYANYQSSGDEESSDIEEFTCCRVEKK